MTVQGQLPCKHFSAFNVFVATRCIGAALCLYPSIGRLPITRHYARWHHSLWQWLQSALSFVAVAHPGRRVVNAMPPRLVAGRRIAWRPLVAEPYANGPPLNSWPDRVAVVAYGYDADYSLEPVVMSSTADDKSWIQIASPGDLRQWAASNSVRVHKYNPCFV